MKKTTKSLKIPSLKEAKDILEQGSKLNPGPWVDHSKYTAKAARNIAEFYPDLNPDTAYVLGLLHDIGRCFGVSHLKHIADGYKFMNSLDYKGAAQICLTHSFPIKNINAYFGKHDCPGKDIKFISEYLKQVKYSEYDYLIQLCDALALPNGFCLIEKRMVDVVLRNGFAKLTKEKWQKTFDIKQQIEKIINRSIYELLPGIRENTFK